MLYYAENISLKSQTFRLLLAMFMSMDMVTGNFDTYNPVFWVGIVIFIGSFIFGIINCIAQISASVRRCHDIGKTGAVVALCFLPYFFIGDIAWYIVAAIDSKEANQWGENTTITSMSTMIISMTMMYHWFLNM